MDHSLSVADFQTKHSWDEIDTAWVWVTFGVVVLHFIALTYFSEDSKPATLLKPAAKVVVKTVKLKEERKLEKSAPVQAGKAVEHKKIAESPKDVPESLPKVVEKPVEVQKEALKPKVEAKKKVVKESPKPPAVKREAKPVPKQAVPKVEAQKGKSDEQKKKLLRQAQESLAKIDKTSDKLVANVKGTAGKKGADALKTPGRLEALTIDAQSVAGWSAGESLYRDELSAQLKLFLRLPELGKVEVRLTLLRSGQVSKVLIVSSESEMNAAYVKSALPNLVFSPFGSNFAKAGQYTFHITLTNES